MRELFAQFDLYNNAQFVESFKAKVGESLKIGRKGFPADIQVNDETISKSHALIVWHKERIEILDTYSSNGTFLEGIKIGHDPVSLKEGDKVFLGKRKGTYIVVKKITTTEKTKERIGLRANENSLSDFFKKYEKVTIGRIGYDAILELEDSDKIVSKSHAVVSKKGKKYFIEDLNSRNGTYLNSQRIPPQIPTEVTENDTIFIGLHALKINGYTRDLGRMPAIQLLKMTKSYQVHSIFGKKPQRIEILKEISIEVAHQEFIALIGPSGCGKSTLLKAMNNRNPATTGQVFLHGLDLKENFDWLKRKIGYVPQENILHNNLTVKNTLYFAAKLRMGEHVNEDTIQDRITEVLESLNINRKSIRNREVKNLSGGEKKRVAIAVELLNNPTILFLDEPTSPLDPGTIKDFLSCLRRLKTEGMTIVMVTHKPDDLPFVDRVLFLTCQGHLAYFGKEGKEMKDYFQKEKIIDIYQEVSKEKNALTWDVKWKERNGTLRVKEFKNSIKPYKDSAWHQFYWLSKRYLRIKLNDRGNIILLLLQPSIIAFLIYIAFNSLQLGVLFLMSISAIWFGTSNASKEIVEELPIYFRERMFNMKIGSYLLSKILILSLIAIIQILLFVFLIDFAFKGNEISIVMEGQYFLFLSYLAVSATLFGLFISTIFPNVEKVLTIIPIVLIPQILLSGVITTLDSSSKETLSYFTLGRWGTEGLAQIQDSNPKYLIEKKVVEKIFKDNQLSEIPTEESIFQVESIYYPIQRPSDYRLWLKPKRGEGRSKLYKFEADEENRSGAMDLLNYYDENRIGLLKEFGIWAPIIAISLLNGLVLIMLYLAMKLKET